MAGRTSSRARCTTRWVTTARTGYRSQTYDFGAHLSAQRRGSRVLQGGGGRGPQAAVGAGTRNDGHGKGPSQSHETLLTVTVEPHHRMLAVPNGPRGAGIPNLCLAGGVALNCVANGKVLRDSRFDDIWIQPAAGGAGGALGTASIDTTAEALAAGEAVGWFQGRMEFGPRPLGNRSILRETSARPPCKRRSTLKGEAPRVVSPAVTDVDYSARVQTVHRETTLATTRCWRPSKPNGLPGDREHQLQRPRRAHRPHPR